MSRIIETVKNKSGVFVASAAALTASGSALADNTAAVTEAIAAGTALTTLTTGGILSVAAVCFGVGLVASMLIKR
ncbi:hypothetical protein [Vibrio lentus]|uniref:hypothetical protein n=1 Tax=Vibrio lentus TaxID=136468 RepID=UPI000C85877D|nr:hypothetical protein [Vibrio lentus]PMI15260.1 hypothetical protein BCU51_18365 [Vibrio lentus]PMK36322.1 hypothetical protein BCU02_01375 [Vibrio lentus]